MEQKKRREAKFIAREGIDFIFKDNRIVLSPDYIKGNRWKFAKITATRLPGVLGIGSDLNSPVKLWAQMVKIYQEDMDPMVSNVGTTLEPKIREYVENYFKLTKKIDFKYTAYVPKENNYDLWKKENKYFGGIPDGEPTVNGVLDFSQIPLLEIKTCSIDALKYKKDGPIWVLDLVNGEPVVKTPNLKKTKWVKPNGEVVVPEEYATQLSLYLYLRNQTKGLIVCYLVETKDYAHPDNIIIDKDHLVGKYVKLDRAEFEKKLAKARAWYDEFIEKGISPELTDQDWLWIKDVKEAQAK